MPYHSCLAARTPLRGRLAANAGATVPAGPRPHATWAPPVHRYCACLGVGVTGGGAGGRQVMRGLLHAQRLRVGCMVELAMAGRRRGYGLDEGPDRESAPAGTEGGSARSIPADYRSGRAVRARAWTSSAPRSMSRTTTPLGPPGADSTRGSQSGSPAPSPHLIGRSPRAALGLPRFDGQGWWLGQAA